MSGRGTQYIVITLVELSRSSGFGRSVGIHVDMLLGRGGYTFMLLGRVILLGRGGYLYVHVTTGRGDICSCYYVEGDICLCY